MRKLVIALVVLFGFSFSLQAVGFSKKADGQPILVQEGLIRCGVLYVE